MSMSMTDTPMFRAIAVTMVPEAEQLSADEWRQCSAVIDSAMARRPARIRRQLSLFIRILNLATVVRYGRPLTHLSVAQRTKLLMAFENSRVLLLRRGLWGVRTLVFMGFYARPEVGGSLGYAAAPRGWELRR
jgi:hypothetical protein